MCMERKKKEKKERKRNKTVKYIQREKGRRKICIGRRGEIWKEKGEPFQRDEEFKENYM